MRDDAGFKVKWIPSIVTLSISLGAIVFAAGVGQGKADALERRVEALERKDLQRDKDIAEIKKGISLLVCKSYPDECLKQIGGGRK